MTELIGTSHAHAQAHMHIQTGHNNNSCLRFSRALCTCNTLFSNADMKRHHSTSPPRAVLPSCLLSTSTFSSRPLAFRPTPTHTRPCDPLPLKKKTTCLPGPRIARHDLHHRENRAREVAKQLCVALPARFGPKTRVRCRRRNQSTHAEHLPYRKRWVPRVA